MLKVPISSLRHQISLALLRQGHTEQDTRIISELLLYAELRRNNQGIVKLVSGALKPHADQRTMHVVHETPVSAKINGEYNSGMVILRTCTDMAIEKATTSGIGLVGCSNYASATGALGYWANEISRHNFIGIVMSQCPEMVAPHGSYEPIYGTNPIAIGIPSSPHPTILDMATSSSAWFGLQTAAMEGQSIPDNIAYDASGRATTDPIEAMKGALRSFDRSFKGSHLALMIELLAGAWTGAAMLNKHESNNWGSLVLAINPIILGTTLEEFQANVGVMCERVKNAKKLPNDDAPIYLPGERGDLLARQQLEAGTVEISETAFKSLQALVIS